MVSKISALVTALAKLHKFCIVQSCTKDGIDDTLVYLRSDEDNIFTNEDGFVAVQGVANNYCCPDLMGGGEHSHNIPNKNFWRSKIDQNKLPHTALHQYVIDSHKTRP